MKKIFTFSFLLLCLIFLFSCTKRSWDNPYDPACSSSTWMANIDSISQKIWSDKITISWTNPSKKVDDIVIERAIGSGAFTQVAKLPYGTETWTDKNIQQGGVLYTYKVYAVAGQNKSEISEKQITPILPPTVSLKINDLKSDSATISADIKKRGGKIDYCVVKLSKTPDFENPTNYFTLYSPDTNISKRVKIDDATTYYSKVIVYSYVDQSNIENAVAVEKTFTSPITTLITWDSIHKINNYNGDTYYSKIQADTLVIGDNVEAYNYGSSEVIINVKVLKMGRNSVIRVRNGYYPYAPGNSLSNFVYSPDSELYPNSYGKGGNGGYGVGYGGGGGGGFGGGYGGGCDAGSGATSGSPNGGNGGNGPSYLGAYGGGQYSVGENGAGPYAGGGGNSGNGGMDAGGGGGYGGGLLLINASEIIYNQSNPPKFIVLGQKGGQGGGEGAAGDGQNGQGGILIINCPNYHYSKAQWDLNDSTYGTHNYNTGHGIVTGNPSKVFINGNIVEDNTK